MQNKVSAPTAKMARPKAQLFSEFDGESAADSRTDKETHRLLIV